MNELTSNIVKPTVDDQVKEECSNDEISYDDDSEDEINKLNMNKKTTTINSF
jgi:hypothetical protein